MPDKGPQKPSQTEDEYFTREDAEKKRKLALQVKRETAADEARRLRDLHFMHCPKCGMEMHEVKLLGVDVDVCFSCDGIFLDKDELAHLQRQAQTGKPGVVDAILNWFRPETKAPGR
jgi:hypothetical protein